VGRGDYVKNQRTRGTRLCVGLGKKAHPRTTGTLDSLVGNQSFSNGLSYEFVQFMVTIEAL
jgi:hypothetical protein